jgi:hypothetical protein
MEPFDPIQTLNGVVGQIQVCQQRILTRDFKQELPRYGSNDGDLGCHPFADSFSNAH